MVLYAGTSVDPQSAAAAAASSPRLCWRLGSCPGGLKRPHPEQHWEGSSLALVATGHAKRCLVPSSRMVRLDAAQASLAMLKMERHAPLT